MTWIRNAISRHQVTAFFSLALGLTWLAFVPWYMSGGEGIPFFTFGPAVAAFTLAALTGGWTSMRALLGAMTKWRVGAWWYVVALGLPFGIQLVSILLNPLFGSELPQWDRIPALAGIVPMVLLYAVFSGPLGEEPGWRGFALPRLLESHSFLVSSLVIGAVWTAWHLPLGLVGDLSSYGLLTTLLAAFVFTWLSQRTGGSVLLAILMHASHQNSVRFLGKVYVEGDLSQQQWIGTALWAGLVVAILAIHGAKGFAKPLGVSRTVPA